MFRNCLPKPDIIVYIHLHRVQHKIQLKIHKHKQLTSGNNSKHNCGCTFTQTATSSITVNLTKFPRNWQRYFRRVTANGGGEAFINRGIDQLWVHSRQQHQCDLKFRKSICKIILSWPRMPAIVGIIRTHPFCFIQKEIGRISQI